MKTADIINQVCSQLGIAKADLAKYMGMYPSSFYRKLSNENMTFEELQKCLYSLGVMTELKLVYPDSREMIFQASYEQYVQRMEILKQELETAHKVSEFQKQAMKELRTELNSAVGYVELCKRHRSDSEKYLEKLQMVHASMERSLSYSLGEAFEDDTDEREEVNVEAFNGQRLLLVEDNELNREILKEMLLDHGLVVEEADNGNKAISLVKERVPGYYQFILMDIEMPKLDGYDTTLRIRKLPNRMRANIPIIALTANGNEESREKAFAVGMDDFLMKPVNTTRLLGCMAKFL